MSCASDKSARSRPRGPSSDRPSGQPATWASGNETCGTPDSPEPCTSSTGPGPGNPRTRLRSHRASGQWSGRSGMTMTPSSPRISTTRRRISARVFLGGGIFRRRYPPRRVETKADGRQQIGLPALDPRPVHAPGFEALHRAERVLPYRQPFRRNGDSRRSDRAARRSDPPTGMSAARSAGPGQIGPHILRRRSSA